MNSFDLTAALVLSAIGTFFIVLFARAIVGALPFSLRGITERLRLKRCQALLKQADQNIEKDALHEACAALRAAFYLDSVRLAPEIIEKVNNHHVAILSRLVNISDKGAGPLTNLPLMEDLLIRRGELLRELSEVRRSRAGVSKRRREKGKHSDWAVSEYSRRISELDEKLTTNRKTLAAQIERLFASLKKAPLESEVTYH